MFCDSLEIIEIEVDVTITLFVKIKMSKKFRALKYKDYIIQQKNYKKNQSSGINNVCLL